MNYDIDRETVWKWIVEGKPFTILDVRESAQFKSFSIENGPAQKIFNVPVSEMFKKSGTRNIFEGAASYARKYLPRKIKKDQTVVVVCSRGNSGRPCTRGLREVDYLALHLEGGMTAWGNFMLFRTLKEKKGVTIVQIARPARGCLSYLIASEGEVVVIDPMRQIDPYIQYAKKRRWKIKMVLDTHCHADHISGGIDLAEKTKTPYYLHPYDAIHPTDMVPALESYEYLRDEQIFEFGKSKLEAIHIPGHTLGLTAFLLDGRNLFCGDSLFFHSIARPDLGGYTEAWALLQRKSLLKLMKLPNSTHVYPGHYTSLSDYKESTPTLKELKQTNRGLIKAKEGEKAFLDYILKKLSELPEEYFDIKRVNLGLLDLSEDEMSFLELGKNLCALKG